MLHRNNMIFNSKLRGSSLLWCGRAVPFPHTVGVFLSGVPIDVFFGLRMCVLRDVNDFDKSSLWEQLSLSDHLSQISQQESVAVKKL